MRDEGWASMGAIAGALAVVLFAAGALLSGERPGFDAPAGELVAYLEAERTNVQIAGVLFAAMAPLLVWWLATVSSPASRHPGPGAVRAATVAFGCGPVFPILFLADVTALEVSVLRPDNMA